MPPRTIDNLGVDVSTRYAEDQKTLDQSMVKEARAVSAQTEIEVTTPFLPSELEALLQSQNTYISWASFYAPAHYFEQRNRLFTYQLIPAMGSDDKKESQAQKILAKLRTLEKEEKGEKDKRKKYEEARALEEEENEKKVLTSLLDTIALYDKLIIDINSRRSQYQKG